jgi:hypothetical protein
MKSTLVTIAILVLTSAAIAAETPKSGSDASAAFEKLKALSGQWESQGKTGKAHLSYEVVSGGNAVFERDVNQGMPDMITVYYLDGDRLLLTHYCMAGNQPRMQAQRFDPQTGELKFDFLDATNLTNPGAGHMHDAKLRLIDNDHLATTWEFYENGKPKFSETAEFTRVH